LAKAQVPEKPEPVTGFLQKVDFAKSLSPAARRQALMGEHQSILLMNTRSSPLLLPSVFAAVLALLALAPAAQAAAPALIDDFSATDHTSCGAGRLLIDDKGAGSSSHAMQRCEKGVLVVEGDLVPGRGAPAFISVPLLLAADAKPQDLGAYEGVRMRIKLRQGVISLQVSSADIQNFDYHAAVIAGKRGEFVEVRIPFKDLKRAWSEQTPLNKTNVTSVNLVAFAMAKGPFAYEVDEIGFY
jgi:hypothetical protein